jgi:hypothetical protein
MHRLALRGVGPVVPSEPRSLWTRAPAAPVPRSRAPDDAHRGTEGRGLMNVEHDPIRALVRVSSPDRRVWSDIDDVVWNRETGLHDRIAQLLLEARAHGVNGQIMFTVTVTFDADGERIEALSYELVR